MLYFCNFGNYLVSTDKPKEATVTVKEVAKVKTVSESEFISDKFIATEKDFAEIQENINKLGLGMGKEAESDKKESSNGKNADVDDVIPA